MPAGVPEVHENEREDIRGGGEEPEEEGEMMDISCWLDGKYELYCII